MKIRLRKGQYVSFDDGKGLQLIGACRKRKIGKILRIKKGIAFLECMTSIQDRVHTHLRKNEVENIYVHCDDLRREFCVKVYMTNETLMHKIATTRFTGTIPISVVKTKSLVEKVDNGAKLAIVYNNNESHMCHICSCTKRNDNMLTLWVVPVELQKI